MFGEFGEGGRRRIEGMYGRMEGSTKEMEEGLSKSSCNSGGHS